MRLLKNAVIYTLDPETPQADALLLDGGRVVAAGKADELVSAAGRAPEVEDLAGAVVLPGLTDAHLHLQHYALGLRKVDCETGTLSECLERVARRVSSTPPGEWVLGHGWQQNDWADCTEGQDGFPSAAMLDAVSGEHPIYLTAKSLHAGWANHAALEKAGLHRGTEDPPDGALQRSSAEDLTGILLEGAMNLVAQVVPKETEAGLQEAMVEAQRTLWSLGLTGVHDFDRRACFIALQQLHAAGELGLRVVKNIPVEDLDHAIGLGLRGGFGDDLLWIGNVKAFADGALGPRTAAMLHPYEDNPDNRGMLLLDREQLYEYGRQASRNGLAMTVHAIGDAANHEVLEAIASLRILERTEGLPPRRHRIEHAQLLHPDDLPRLSALGVIASMQPIHATSDMLAADRFWGDRARFSYAWRALLDQGTQLAFGSDAPVESPNPFWGLHAAVTRRRADGSPGPDGWRPEQKLTRLEALQGFTTGAAFAGGREARLGKIAPGFLADLTVLEQDYFHIEEEAIRDLKPVRVMVGGTWVF